MKKVILSLLFVLLVTIVFIYILIPSHVRISHDISVNCTAKKASEFLNNQDKWKLWWPKNDNPAQYNGYSYSLLSPLTDGANILVSKNDDSVETRIQFIPTGKDSITINWFTDITTGKDPVTKIIRNGKADNIKKSMLEVLKRFALFLDKTDHTYGFDILRTTFPDTFLIATKFSGSGYPDVSTIYTAVDKIRAQIKKEGAKEIDDPMINVNMTDSNHYETRVAIAVDRILQGNGDIFFSRMLTMKDRFLMTALQGGPAAIKQAHKAIFDYMEDHLLTAPGISFEIMITDRRTESDTSKWKTRIFYPSM